MRNAILLLFFAAAGAAQNPNTAVFPGRAATDSDLLVATNNARSALAAAITDTTSTSVVLANAAKFAVPLVVTIDGELLFCTTKASNTLTCSRGFEGSTAAKHAINAGAFGNVIDWHHNQIAAEIKSIEKRSLQTFYVTDYGALGDGSTNDTAAFQAASDAISAAGGGGLFIPKSPTPYIVGIGIKIHSNTNVYSDSQATVVKKIGGAQPTCSDTGCSAVFYTDPAAATSNIHFQNFTIDGNQAAVTGITGDGGNFGIIFQGASDSGTLGMIVKNAYTGGVTVSCWGSPATNAGNNVTILDTIVTASRRNNLEVICGTNTRMIGGALSYATGGSLSTGVDLEPFTTGQLVNGFQLLNVEVHHNRDGGILIQSKYDLTPSYSVIDCNVHDNTGLAGLSATNYNVPGSGAAAGTVSVIGGTYANNGTAANLSFAAWTHVNVSGETSYGSPRGLLLAAKVTTAILGPGMLSGSLYDLSVDGPASVATLAGVTLTCSVACIQPGEEVNVRFPLTGTPINFTGNGVPYWPAVSPRTGAMAVSSLHTLDFSSNPGYVVSDGTNTAELQVIAGAWIFGGSKSALAACWAANNKSSNAGFCVDATGLKPYILGIPVFANNAAAVAGGLTLAGMLYRLTGTDQLAIVH